MILVDTAANHQGELKVLFEQLLSYTSFKLINSIYHLLCHKIYEEIAAFQREDNHTDNNRNKKKLQAG